MFPAQNTNQVRSRQLMTRDPNIYRDHNLYVCSWFTCLVKVMYTREMRIE